MPATQVPPLQHPPLQAPKAPPQDVVQVPAALHVLPSGQSLVCLQPQVPLARHTGALDPAAQTMQAVTDPHVADVVPFTHVPLLQHWPEPHADEQAAVHAPPAQLGVVAAHATQAPPPEPHALLSEVPLWH